MRLLLAQTEFDPSHEWDLPAWVPIHLGPLDLSINKAVAYLWLGGLVTILFGIWFMRFGLSLRPSRRQTTGEALYDVLQTQVAGESLPAKAVGRWFPYVAALFLYIWILNVISFIPLPISDERFTLFGLEMPTWAIFAATSNLSVTLALALVTFFISHYEGIRWNGTVPYFKSWIPSGLPKLSAGSAVLYLMIGGLEILSQLMRVISLSVRLYANLLAGHMLILILLGLIIVFENYFVAIVAVPFAMIVYAFEVIIVVTIQAFVFALLSAIYIGGAIEPEH